MDFYVSMRMAPRQLMTFHGEKGWLSVHAAFNAGAYGDEVIELRRSESVVTKRALSARGPVSAPRPMRSTPASSTAPHYACPLEFSRGNQVMIDMIYAAAPAHEP